MSILAVGTVAFDSIETPFGSAERVLGGSGSYITLASRYFTDDVRLVGVVGNDFPDEYRQTLLDGGVDLEGLDVNEDGKTFFWHGRYHYDMNERDTLETQLNVLEGFAPDIPASYNDSQIVCLGNLDPKVQRDVLRQVDDPGYVIADTMNFWIENTPESLRETLKLVDCLVINDSEARELADEPNLVTAADVIRDMGPETLIIKKGEHGALLFANGSVFSAPAYPLEDIQDPTGAGDAFAGGLAGHLVRAESIDHEALRRAVVYGSVMASFVVERFGPERLLELGPIDISERAQSFRDLAAIPSLVSVEKQPA
ncbi:sugar kinase [Salinibacter sp. 10B]|uniref:PfkB family carbohydrate kinase n=1 Tax=Salinibacter sp. 10B TaxID=1923971 RepID=UPI000CF4CBF8|nr:PfkB family carbohydrate kinase [Salinibacter sp. 10B]PQJ33515.1 sugar kinase [Salinibacter sp. 10B]